MFRLSVFFLFCLPVAPVFAVDPPADFAQPQSKAKPMPTGLKMIDQGKFDPRLKGYITPDGFKLEIVADESVTINPVGMTFDSKGTCYVLEWVPDVSDRWNEVPEKFTYKDGTTRNVATMKKTVKDVVKILTRDPATGQFTKSEIILHDELPSSILIHDGWIYLSGRGSIRRFKQSKPGGPYDVKEVIAQGFCGFHHHQVSGMTIGPDGWLYITSGDDDNYVEGSDGSRATVLRTGAIFRCLPDGSKMEEYARGFRNPYRDISFDDKYNIFHVDNDNEDGSKFTGCRIMHVPEAVDFGWRLLPGARCCLPDHLRGAVAGELPGKVPPMMKTGRGSPAGLLIYNDTQLPKFYRGLLYYPDVFRKLIRAYEVAPKGSTFTITHEFEFLKSEDPLFRPCQMVTGPDGAIYIVDWRTNSGGAGKLFGDGVHGRIYRLTWIGGEVPGGKEEPKIALRDWQSWETEQVSDWENFTVRSHAFIDYIAQCAKNDTDKQNAIRLLQAMVQNKSLPRVSSSSRYAALGGLFQLRNDSTIDLFLSLLQDVDPDMRRLCAEYLGRLAVKGDTKVLNALAQLLTDEELSVRRSAALALGRIGDASTADVLVNVLKFDDGMDVYYTDALIRSFERLGKPGFEKLLELAASGKEVLRDKVVGIFLAFRTREAALALPELLSNVHISAEQRAELIRSYANYQLDPPLALDSLIDFLTKRKGDPIEVVTAAVSVLSESGQIKSERAVPFVFKLLDEKEEAARAAAIKAIETARITKAVPKLVAMLEDKSRELSERLNLLKTLRVLKDKSATEVLRKILSGEEPTALRTESLRTLVTIDSEAAREFASKFLVSGDANLQRESVTILGDTLEGAKKVGEMFAAKKLPRDLLPQVSEGLRKHLGKHAELATLLSDVMKGGLLLSLDGAQVEKIRTEIQTKGDPRRGKQIYMNTTTLACMNCHKMEGLGGNVGPDLTRLWDTMSVEKILESIIEPSKEIKEGYQSFQVITKEGKTITGLKTVDKPTEVTIRDANGQDTRILRDDIEEIKVSKVSLMPDNVVAQLSYSQMLDLVAFLKNRQSQESLRGYVTDFKVVGPFPGDLKKPFGPEKQFEATASFPVENSKEPLKWQPRSGKTNGYLDFKEVFNKDNMAGYGLTYVYSPKSQKSILRLGANSHYQVWVNGNLVRSYEAAVRPNLPEQDEISVDLKEGWNPVVVKVVSKSKDHGFYLKVEGDQLKTSANGK